MNILIMDKLPNYKELNEKNKYLNKTFTFKTIFELYHNTKQITLPPIQGNLDDDTVSELVNEYRENKYLFKCKNNICIGATNYDSNNKDEYKYYLIDGQHRVEMAKNLLENWNIDDTFSVNFYFCDSRLQLKKLFNSLNQDSNKAHIWSYEFDDILEETKVILQSKYKSYFSKSSGKEKKIYTIDQFIKKLTNTSSYIKNSSNGKKLVKKLIKKNIEFNTNVNTIGYKQLIIDIEAKTDKREFYADELKIFSLEPFYTFGFKNNNFIEWLADKKNTEPQHLIFKEKRVSHDKALREKVWNHEFKKKIQAECPVYKCSNMISKTNFDVGHVISVKNGGETILSNLRPICHGCNMRMGSTDWTDYIDKLKELDSDSDSD